ncbi:HAMP domain-containing sensor histidine kinase [Pseudoduganella ginsengisoli]|uniref:histidine kinase n=1 Tax=Pseudoduganella ginsengisoli TaxID=1462440 RepID=A0A6L6PZR1_9BURK|nr:HAMP domain-containing sensor histidine kinase [Pseudoduganella ginsengisoli]MTW02252.1 HAMP domain-containing protein [Pseudoduganella ginsengisoli]
MPRLYFRFYIALLASLALFTAAAALLWHYAGPFEPSDRALGLLLRNTLPPVTAPAAEQQAALTRLTKDIKADITLYSREGERLAYVGEPLPRPTRGMWRERRMMLEHGSGSAGSASIADEHERMMARHFDRDEDGHLRPRRFFMRLDDGRLVVSSTPLRPVPPRYRLHYMLIALAIIIAIGAYPVVRRLTRRLERLQRGVESLGEGKLSARVKVEGNDEVALLAASFNRSADQIEALVGAHKTLLANASHELRTPLARIRLALELSRDSVDEKRRAGLEQDIAELDQLIDEILLASRLDMADVAHDKGGAHSEREQLDVLALAAEECARYDEAELEGESAVVHGEARLLRRLLRNLLENARRHGAPPTKMHVRCAGNLAEITVQDAGPGVPPADQDRIFEPFYRSGNARDSTGTGLGLALVRQIARRHGGDVRCEQVRGGASRFVVTLPLG